MPTAGATSATDAARRSRPSADRHVRSSSNPTGTMISTPSGRLSAATSPSTATHHQRRSFSPMNAPMAAASISDSE